MNCQPGDLAIVIKGRHNAGKVVRCIKIVTATEFPVARVAQKHFPMWQVNRPLLWHKKWIGPVATIEIPFVPDRFLRRLDGYQEHLEDSVRDAVLAEIEVG